jgi:Flp pilus assembly protein TadG
MDSTKIVQLSVGRGRRGQALVELAIILPVILLLLLGALDFGRVYYAQITITNAAKEGVLVASRGGTFVTNAACSATNTVMCAVLTEAKGGFVGVDQAKVIQNPSGNVVCPSNAAVGTTVSVSVNAPFRLITPFIGVIFGGQDMTLGATAHAECAVLPPVTLLPEPTPTPCALVLVPTVNGLAAPTAANNAITGVGLTPGGIADLTTGPKGNASNQSPAAGTCVASGSTVTYHYRPS